MMDGMTTTTPTKRTRATKAPEPVNDPGIPAAPALEDDEPKPTNVIAALARVQAAIGGIEKLSPEQRKARGIGGEERGITYAYRGIDQIASAAQPLFGRYGIVIVPTVCSFDVKDIIINAKPWTDSEMVVEWVIYGPGGVDDHIEARTIGQGRDNSDKSANKAMTGAYKNLLLRLLTIGDPGDDPDTERHERDQAAPPVEDTPDVLEARALYERIRTEATADPKVAAAMRTLGDDQQRGFTIADLADPAWRATVESELDIAMLPDSQDMGEALALAFEGSEVVEDGSAN